ncbi:MAG: family 1 glycosylhydrolase [Candidatus Dojkabacteria bacterium]
MNPSTEILNGISISNQHATPQEPDFELASHFLEILNNHSPRAALEAIENDFFVSFQTPLSDMGLNYQSLRNIIKTLVAQNKDDEAVDILKDILDLIVWGIDNEVVREKFINLLKLFDFKILRFALDWSKILTKDQQPNYSEIAKYKEFSQQLILSGITPIITFSHFETNGLNILSDEFEKIFDRLTSAVLSELIPPSISPSQNEPIPGVKYWLAFNEPAVHAGGMNIFWGNSEFTAKDINPKEVGYINAFFNGIKQASLHVNTLNRIGYLSKKFYEKAHRFGEANKTDVKVIANFNISVFDTGTSKNLIEGMVASTANYVDKDLQIGAYRRGIGVDGEILYGFDVAAINPYQIYKTTVINKFLRDKLSRFISADILLKLFPDTTNPKLMDPNLTRIGTHGQILSPHAIGTAIRHMVREYRFKEIVLTETGSDTSFDTPEGKINKTWYASEVKKELEMLVQEGISIPFSLIWTLIRMWEIVGPKGGGGGEWDFGILGEPMGKDEISTALCSELNIEENKAKILTEEMRRKGDTPLKMYEGMIDQLGNIFRKAEVFPDELVESLITKDKNGNYNILVDILQVIQLRKYYEAKQDEISCNYLLEIEELLRNEYFENSNVPITLVEA